MRLVEVVINTSGWFGITHALAHVVIFFSYVAACVIVPSAFKRLIRVSVWTSIFGGGFFLFCGITHAGIFLDQSQSLLFSITDHLQAGCIVGFLVYLAKDLARASFRLTRAMIAVRYYLDDDTADKVQRTIQDALKGE